MLSSEPLIGEILPPRIENGAIGIHADPVYLPEEVSLWLGVSLKELRAMRERGDGPDFVRCGNGAYRYRWSALSDWMDDNTNTLKPRLRQVA